MILTLIIILTSLIISGVCVTLLGYAVHWCFHQPWSRGFYDSHMSHHKIQYPPIDFSSDTYRSSGIDSAVILFTVAFSPLLIGLGLLTYFGVVPLVAGVSGLAGSIGWGLLHSYIHDQFHLNNSIWNRFFIFRFWKKLHYIHHLNMNLNLGIFVFIWDRLFHTFDDNRHLPE